MLLAQRVAGYTLAEADNLRKAIGKKKRIMQAEAEKFLRRAVERTPRRKAEEIWGLIEPFARYGFNKSHAVAYALLAYQTAYLKAHYPVHFMGACLTSSIGSTDEIVRVMGECTIAGVPVLPPDINESRRSFAATRQAIRFGLAAVRGVGDSAAHAILEERGRRPFTSFTDFLFRTDPHLVNRRRRGAHPCGGSFVQPAPAFPRRGHGSLDRASAEAGPGGGQSDLFGATTGEGPADDAFEDAARTRSRKHRSRGIARLLRHRHPLAKFAESGALRRDGRPRRGMGGQVGPGWRGYPEFRRVEDRRASPRASSWPSSSGGHDGNGPGRGLLRALREVRASAGGRPPHPVDRAGARGGRGIERPGRRAARGSQGPARPGDRIRLDLTLADENVLSLVHESCGRIRTRARVAVSGAPGEFEATVKTNGTLSVASPTLTDAIRSLAGERAVRYVRLRSPVEASIRRSGPPRLDGLPRRRYGPGPSPAPRARDVDVAVESHAAL